MDIVRFVIQKPVAVAVGVILLVMFGLIGVTQIPVQLVPNVDRPIVTVQTNWTGRNPEEIVDEITKEQEEQLKNVANLRSMRSVSSQGQSQITLEFNIGSDINRALQEVSDALRQVPDYPDDADEPTIKAADGASENAIAWIIIEVEPDRLHLHPDFDITTIFDALEKEVKPYLERIDGVAEINIYGGREREVRVLVDPGALVQYQVTYTDLLDALRAENNNISAGEIAEGKRDYSIRVIGRFEKANDVLDTIIKYVNGAPIFVRDVADVDIGHQKIRGFVRGNGNAAVAMNCIRQSNANVLNLMAEFRARLDDIRADILPNIHPEVGPDLRMRQVYDETVYIDSAINLVKQNLWVGGLIAMAVLLLFLRSFVSTGVVALAIPISVIGSFLIMLALHRTLNVISLAGLAFAVGMVVDNAIVVLENIYRRLQSGDSPKQAAYRGGREVWGAILASTLTTVAVFVPVLTIQEEAGQLFSDISIAIIAAVALSLIVSITVIPAACSRWLSHHSPEDDGPIRRAWDKLFGVAPMFSRLVESAALGVRWLMTGWRGWTLRPAVIVGMMALSLLGAKMLMPPLDYLPAGNRNLVFGGLLIPPGYSVDQRLEIANRIENDLKPYIQTDVNDAQAAARLAPIPQRNGAPFDPVPIKNYFIGSFGGGMFIGARSQIEQVVLPVGQLLTNAMNDIPDAFGGARQSSLFGRGAGGGNTIDLEISGPRLDRVRAAADRMNSLASARYGHEDVRPDPSNFNLDRQEWQLRLTNLGRELGLRTRDVGESMRALFDGAFVGDFSLNDDTIDLVLIPKGGRLLYKEQLASVPIYTPAGRVVPLDSVVSIEPALAPQQIQRIEELPSVTLRITPPKGSALEDVMREVQEEIIAPVEQAGLIDHTMRVRLEGTAAKLDEVKRSLVGAATSAEKTSGWQTVGKGAAGVFFLITALLSVFIAMRAFRRSSARIAYGAAGALFLGGTLAAMILAVSIAPQLAGARLIWALVVTYLLMAALFESFLYPLVIMFTVPLAIVGGFAGLKIVHEITLANPVIAPQQLDVLTMLGFVILIGVVVNNAILIVHQSLNFMRGMEFGDGARSERLAPIDAITQSVRTRFRPIFMGTLTSVGGMAPLALFPGAGSELYRGLGSVVIGGLLVSTIFTLVLVPLTFSLVLDMRRGLTAAFAKAGDVRKEGATLEHEAEFEGEAEAPAIEPALQPVG